ncbi:MAG: hypothetical protein ACWGPR_08615 [Candidatus Deferrimicrobiaceae bacterium]
MATRYVTKARKPATKTRRAIAADVIRVQKRHAEAERDLPPFAVRNMRPEVRREFHEADRLGRAKPV